MLVGVDVMDEKGLAVPSVDGDHLESQVPVDLGPVSGGGGARGTN